MKVFICEQCSAEVLSYPSKPKRFCSQSCGAKWRALNVGMPTKPRRGETVSCRTCGADIYRGPNEHKKAYCSNECRNVGNRRGELRPCESCGTEFWSPPSMDGKRFCSRQCYEAQRIKASGAGREHNGREAISDHSGYIRIWQPDHPAASQGRILEHRWVVEQSLGRYLRSDEHVHHKNGKKWDNRLENLEVLGHGEHSSLSGRERHRQIEDAQAELAEYRRRFGPLT